MTVATWNPLESWEAKKIDWVKVDISREDLQRFMRRSDLEGLCHALGFLLIGVITGGTAYWAFLNQHWVVLVLALYFHGLVYGHFGDALHELGHNTVFATKFLNAFFTMLYGLLYWTWNPHLYRLSHTGYHHRYTLHQGSDGEDTPNFVGEITPKLVFDLFFRVIQIKPFVQNLARLVTLKPTSKGWRGRGYALDTWEQFVLKNATEAQRKQVYRFAVLSLAFQIAFVTVCLVTGHWFLVVLVSLAPFYGPGWHGFLCSTHQHAACDANNPDFRVSCGDAILDPLSSFLYWHMEYHIEHHMFASIPCYNLKAFSRFVADQLPPKERALPRLLKLPSASTEKFQTWHNWRDKYGIYKGL